VNKRAVGFALLCVACVSLAGVYLVRAEGAQRSQPPAAKTANGKTSDVKAAAPVPVSDIIGKPHVTFRTLAIDGGDAGKVALAGLDAPDGPRAVTYLKCLRVYLAAGSGICMDAEGGLLNPYRAMFFGPDFSLRAVQQLPGLPSRARVSPDGRYGATTVFVGGDDYASGNFSTRTTIYEMATGTPVGDLEGFTVRNNGKKLQSSDFNFWGVTFSRQDGLFYATLGTGDHRYLVRGDLAAKTVDVLRDGVECPSLSPDGTRIAFKQRTTGPQTHWRPAVLDLATLADHPLAETRNVDDQIEWLDDSTVLYAVDTGFGPPGTWSAPADGSGQSKLFMTDADSPAVAR